MIENFKALLYTVVGAIAAALATLYFQSSNSPDIFYRFSSSQFLGFFADRDKIDPFTSALNDFGATVVFSEIELVNNSDLKIDEVEFSIGGLKRAYTCKTTCAEKDIATSSPLIIKDIYPKETRRIFAVSADQYLYEPTIVAIYQKQEIPGIQKFSLPDVFGLASFALRHQVLSYFIVIFGGVSIISTIISTVISILPRIDKKYYKYIYSRRDLEKLASAYSMNLIEKPSTDNNSLTAPTARDDGSGR